MMDWAREALESVLSILHAVWQHWTSPEFRPVLWAVLAYIIGSMQGYTACLDGQEAAREDADRALRAAASRKEISE